LPGIFAIIRFVVIFEFGSEPDCKTHLIPHRAVA
jgi:hypothetical protein